MIWWCRQKNKPCSMANENGYCQITACRNTSMPTVNAIPLDKPFCKMVYGDYVCYNREWLMKHLQTEWNILQGKEYKPAIPVELYEQVKGERDVAIEQLKSLNIELFEKPYLKAIPIDWINKWVITTNMGAGRTIDRLLEDWEEEQARLFEKQITEECTSAERFAEWEKENDN